MGSFACAQSHQVTRYTGLNSGSGIKVEQSVLTSKSIQCHLHIHILQAGDKSKAAAAFQQLQALDRTSSASAMMLGQLARASANANPQAAVALQKQLPPMPKLSSDIDLDDLEQKGELVCWVVRPALQEVQFIDAVKVSDP